MSDLDQTHDPAAASWVASANDPQTDFPIQNLPLGVFRRRGEASRLARIGVAIGDEILDLTACASDGLLLSLDDDLVACLGDVTLNRVMERGRDASRALRLTISDLLRSGGNERARRADVERCLLSAHDAEMLLPAAIGDYSDFYASIEHATNVGSDVPAGQSAVAELQVGADRLSRARVVDRGERDAMWCARSARRETATRPRQA